MTQEIFEEKFIAKLNDQQHEAVRAVDDAILLLAVPGSGKTTVIVNRIVMLLACKGIERTSVIFSHNTHQI